MAPEKTMPFSDQIGNYQRNKGIPLQSYENSKIYIVGSGIAGMSAAYYFIRDGHVPGKNIIFLDQLAIEGGSLDGAGNAKDGYIIRGGREMDMTYENLWDMFQDIPALELPAPYSVLDEYRLINDNDPNYSKARLIHKQGQIKDFSKFGLEKKDQLAIVKLLLKKKEELDDLSIEDYFSESFLNSNFWFFWRSMFAFENWHSALEMKLYFQRFIHHIGGLPDFSALRFTRYNQYESMILPMIKYLEGFGVQFHYNVKVENVDFKIGGGMGPVRQHTGTGQDTILKKQAESGVFVRNPYSSPTKKMATRIDLTEADGTARSIDLGENDLVFITNGGCVENSTMGSQTEAAAWAPEIKPGGGWDMWRRIAKQDPSFGHPDVFCGDPEHSKWMSATVTTLDDEIPPYIQKICKRDPFSGRVVTGGIVTVEDSNWLMSWTLNRQQQFRDQPKDQLCVWVYGLFPDKPGNYVKKPMQECTGEEICEEWLYHMGVPTDKIADLAKNHANTVPVMMPYIDAFFMPRSAGDRPDVVPDGAVNFAFLGQFAETPRDTIFTTEYSMRTGMEAVYTLCDVDRGVPEVWGSVYDVRNLLNATVMLRDGKPITDMKLNPIERGVLKQIVKKLDSTDIPTLLKEYGVI